MNTYEEPDQPDLENLTVFLQSLGADEAAARTMAAQLIKRAGQLAEERSTSRLAALDYLLKVTIAGREGRVYEGQPPGNGATMRDEGQKKG